MADNVTKPVRMVKNAAQATTDKAARAAESVVDNAFQASGYEMPEFLRSFSEQGLNQARETYARVKATAEEATDAIEETFATTRDGLLEVQFKALDVAKANTEATFDFVRNLLGVTSVNDAVQLQTSFARERFEAFVDYSKDVQTTITKIGTEAGKPAKDLIDRTIRQSKAA